MSAFKLILYGFYNVVWIIFSMQIISYCNMYINSFFIPTSFRWNEQGGLRDELTLFGITQFMIANIESITLAIVMYFVNKFYLINVLNIREHSGAIALWTAILTYIALYLLIFRYFYFIYR